MWALLHLQYRPFPAILYALLRKAALLVSHKQAERAISIPLSSGLQFRAAITVSSFLPRRCCGLQVWQELIHDLDSIRQPLVAALQLPLVLGIGPHPSPKLAPESESRSPRDVGAAQDPEGTPELCRVLQ